MVNAQLPSEKPKAETEVCRALLNPSHYTERNLQTQLTVNTYTAFGKRYLKLKPGDIEQQTGKPSLTDQR